MTLPIDRAYGYRARECECCGSTRDDNLRRCPECKQKMCVRCWNDGDVICSMCEERADGSMDQEERADEDSSL